MLNKPALCIWYLTRIELDIESCYCRYKLSNILQYVTQNSTSWSFFTLFNPRQLGVIKYLMDYHDYTLIANFIAYISYYYYKWTHIISAAELSCTWSMHCLHEYMREISTQTVISWQFNPGCTKFLYCWYTVFNVHIFLEYFLAIMIGKMNIFTRRFPQLTRSWVLFRWTVIFWPHPHHSNLFNAGNWSLYCLDEQPNSLLLTLHSKYAEF